MVGTRRPTHLARWVPLVAAVLSGQAALGFSGHGRPIELRCVATPADHGTPAVPDCFVRFGPLEERLSADAADGRLEEFSLLEAALVASGAEDEVALARYRAKLDGWLDELRESGELSGSPRRQARVVLEFLHGRILKSGYQIEATDLCAAMDEGRFNCVSASVLFNCLAEGVGLEVCGLEMPSHAMSRVILSDGHLDVETTYPKWFDVRGGCEREALREPWSVERVPLLARKQCASRLDGSALLASKQWHTGERTAPREVSDVQMLAMIYYNRGVDLLRAKRFHDAAGANAKALRLDPESTTARGNLLATINNWAIDLGAKGRYAEAAELLRAGREFEPHYATFAPNYVHVHHQWAESLREAGRLAEALEVLARAAEMPEAP